ncbi:hypothetical protein, partial [Cobetia sp. 29-18-1]|uniref:hypothetical protein n=1 Tax=Cobetia sp. 29-18-1 TaxID=3040018 RepID=UPI00244D0EFA
ALPKDRSERVNYIQDGTEPGKRAACGSPFLMPVTWLEVYAAGCRMRESCVWIAHNEKGLTASSQAFRILVGGYTLI